MSKHKDGKLVLNKHDKTFIHAEELSERVAECLMTDCSREEAEAKAAELVKRWNNYNKTIGHLQNYSSLIKTHFGDTASHLLNEVEEFIKELRS